MFDLDKIVRENIKSLVPYSNARDEFNDADSIFLDANENPFGKYNRYPDPYQRLLKNRLAAIKKVSAKNIFLGNGSDEIIDLLFRVFCNPAEDKVLTFSPTYGMYRVSAAINNVKLIDIALTENFQLDIDLVSTVLNEERLKLVFICSPNNPTGNTISENDINYLLNKFGGIVVIDEAYIDFSPNESWSRLVETYPNLVILQTLSKAWGLAGVRLGLALTNTKIIHFLNKVKPPYNISSANQEITLSALQKIPVFEETKRTILAEKTNLVKALSELTLVEKVYPSETNFLLVKVKDADALYKQLLSKQLVVRNRNKAIKNCLRITIGSSHENKLLINELTKLDDAKSTIYR